jgi:hypothetical protein
MTKKKTPPLHSNTHKGTKKASPFRFYIYRFDYKTYLRQNVRNRGSTVTFSLLFLFKKTKIGL